MTTAPVCPIGKGEDGYIVVITLIILMLMTILGIAVTRSTSVELQIAANDKIKKTTFFEADGATEIASELTEQNLGCMSGFTDGGSGYAVIGDDAASAVRVETLAFWQNTDADLPTDANRDMVFPDNYGTSPHTNMRVGGSIGLAHGSAIQMVAGYEGKGKGAGGGGGHILYDIVAQRLGHNNAESVIQIQWRHVIGQEGACNH
jgi:hypothetical protein